jgi:hypothetical protein
VARQRDYKKEYAQRNAKARSLGWRNYAERRRAYRQVLPSEPYHYYRRQVDDGVRLGRGTEDEIVKAFWMLRFEDENGYGPDSWHRYLFVDLLGYISDDEWRRRYPNGVRDYGIG